MKNLLIFIGGFAAGILVTFFVLFAISRGISSTYSKNEIQVQYVEVKGRKGNVTLHTGMSKDSVQLLVGKPDQVDLNELANINYETWGYKLKNEYMSDLDIEFENGKLNGVRQK